MDEGRFAVFRGERVFRRFLLDSPIRASAPLSRLVEASAPVSPKAQPVAEIDDQALA